MIPPAMIQKPTIHIKHNTPMKSSEKKLILALLFAGLYIPLLTAQSYLAGAKQNGKWGFVDTRGTWVIKPAYADVNNFSEGLAGAKEGENWGYFSTTGEWVVKTAYKSAEDFSEGLARVITRETGDSLSL